MFLWCFFCCFIIIFFCFFIDKIDRVKKKIATYKSMSIYLRNIFLRRKEKKTSFAKDLRYRKRRPKIKRALFLNYFLFQKLKSRIPVVLNLFLATLIMYLESRLGILNNKKNTNLFSFISTTKNKIVHKLINFLLKITDL